MTADLWEKRFGVLFPGLLTNLQEARLTFEDGRETQALENMVYVSGAAGLREKLPVSDVCSVIRSVADRWNCRCKSIGSRVFYAWYDDQAGQLRMSIIAGELQFGLPFKAPIRLVAHPEPVAGQYLRGTDVVAWDELEPASTGELASSGNGAPELLVFATELEDETQDATVD